VAVVQVADGRIPSDEEVAAELSLGSAHKVRALLSAGAEAHHRLFYSNVGLVHKVADQYRNSCGVDRQDLVQVRWA
jgi:DNA-directed RNA polymerase specialized sigma subunit